MENQVAQHPTTESKFKFPSEIIDLSHKLEKLRLPLKSIKSKFFKFKKLFITFYDF